MSHVDDGLIHAWLDGALFPGDPKRVAFEKHLEVCDECRTRVEAERRIRDRAADVLQSIAPDAVRVEPFDQMIARRRAERAAAEARPAVQDDVPGRVEAATPITSAPSRRRRFVPLAWAASLLVAVSAGWFGRAYLPSTRPASEDVAGQTAVQAELSPTTAAPSRAASEPQAAPPVAQAEAGAAAAGDARQEGAGGGAQLRDQALGRVSADEEKLAAAKTEVDVRVPETSAAVTRRSLDETLRIANAMIAGDTGLAKAIVPPASTTESAVDPSLEAFRSASWETVTEALATERLGRAPLRIEGLPIDSLTAARSDGRWVVRVVQRLGPDGPTAEIVQTAAALALNELVVTGEPARSGVTADTARRQAEARQRIDDAARRAELLATATGKPGSPPAALPAIPVDVLGYRALLRANVSPDSLKTLAARVR